MLATLKRKVSRKKQQKLLDKTGNQINVIYPYRTFGGGWAFDDKEVGLQGEQFVAGIPEIINSIVGKRRKIKVFLSKDTFPETTGVLVKLTDNQKAIKGLSGEGYYQLEGTDMIGWLCPATLKYFKDYPKKIHFKIC